MGWTNCVINLRSWTPVCVNKYKYQIQYSKCLLEIHKTSCACLVYHLYPFSIILYDINVDGRESTYWRCVEALNWLCVHYIFTQLVPVYACLLDFECMNEINSNYTQIYWKENIANWKEKNSRTNDGNGNTCNNQ